MRICLYWNPAAGGRLPLDELINAITGAGHTVARVLERDDDPADALRLGADALVAAGGDGTVARVARALAGGGITHDLPIAILPLGTANNIATSLGIASDPAEAIADWPRLKVVAIDVGVVTGDDGDRIFIEGVGAGLVVRGITSGRTSRERHGSTFAEVEWARDVFLDALSKLRPQHSRLCIDGEVVEGDYLLVEVLNIASVGPRLRLSAETTPADGLLSVVIAGEEDRAAIAHHLNQSSNDHNGHAWLKSWRAGRVEVAGWRKYHVDDEVLESASGKLAMTIRPASLRVLA